MSNKYLCQLDYQIYVHIEETKLKNLLKTCQILAEHDTLISDYIRILKADHQLIVQEKTIKGEILLRKFKSLHSAQEFVNQRMIIYDKMWDGCGCKIDYYAESVNK